jgi:two-component system sensor histidine kinase/response regulator
MTATKQQQAPNILIVDDTPGNVLLLVRMLTERGYKPRPVLSGKLALQAARTEPPDLILLDITMPEMNGYEVCEQLKADAALKDIPVIFISALNETIDKVKAFRVGGVDYVTKPFQFEEVHARVETHLRIRSLQRQLSDQNENLERLVAERTRELLKAYERLQELGRLKDDFLGMISHEIRTPANGVLGVGNLVLALCPPSEDRTLYADLFERSSLRLHNLMEDAIMITDMEKLTLKNGAAISFPDLLAEVRASLPDIQISIEQSAALETFFLKGYHPLLKRALESMILLATSFSRNKHTAHLTGVVEERVLRVHIEVDALSLSGEQVAVFFEIESSVRSASSAESLGLAPVVAHQIISAFGGEMRLVKGEGYAGYLEAILLKEQNHV